MDPIKNYDEVVANLRRIVTSPSHPYPEELVKKLEKDYLEKNKKSFEMFEEAKKYIPGGVEHNLSLNHPFPLAVDRVKGCKIWDVDGNEYIDYLMCGAPIIIGHAIDEIDNKVIELIKEKGPASGVTSEYEILAAKEIVKHMPAVDMVRFFASGTEADMAAIRLARVYTDKEKIIKIGGSYHGWSDQLVYSLHIPGTGPLEASGIPKSVNQNTISVPPNHEKKLRRAFEKNQDKGGIAAVILEPIGGESGTHPVHPEWNKYVRELCDEYGTLLIFDEVVTGFRLGMGGAQKFFNVMPDLTVLGKIIGHGYPTCGALGGKKEIMLTASAGIEGIKKKAYTGGTLSANPILTCACYHTLKYIEKHNAAEKAAAYADKLTKELNELYETREDLPFFAYNYKSIIHNETSSFLAIRLTDKDALNQITIRRKIAEEYQLACHLKNIHLLQGSRIYTCMMHDQEALDKTIKAFEYMLSLIPKN
ncbi:MAG: aminotransferase class III-fold pyridoxal phosphate-dependent enzyme [Candidatus Lokiarchaeota archaeon]|nr:aminotransferase class III-fold pyridoxal phosphate-dependent enzyme [Candidatus Lokiarchaeota archaeon]